MSQEQEFSLTYLDPLKQDIWNNLVEKSLHPHHRQFSSFSPLEILLEMAEMILQEIDIILHACLQDQDSGNNAVVRLPKLISTGLDIGNRRLRFKEETEVHEKFRKYLFHDIKRDQNSESFADYFVVKKTSDSNLEIKKEVEQIEVKPEVIEGEEADEAAVDLDPDPDDDDEEEEDEDDLYMQFEDEGDYSDHESKNKFPCKVCGKKLSNRKSLRTHLNTHSSAEGQQQTGLTCGSCGKSYATKDYLRAHIKRAHRDPELEENKPAALSFDCFFCAFSCDSERAKLAHERSHEGPLRCAECGKSYADKEKYKRHQRNIHSKAASICDWCGSGFRNVIYLREHVRNMHSEIHILCKDCGQQVKRSAYRGHRERKHPVAPLQRTQCEFCEKTFRSKKTLRVHQACVHGKGDRVVLTCAQCPRKFISEFHLQEHVRTHLGLKLSCQNCSKQFSHKQSLVKHMRNENCGGLSREEDGVDKLPSVASIVGLQSMSTMGVGEFSLKL